MEDDFVVHMTLAIILVGLITGFTRAFIGDYKDGNLSWQKPKKFEDMCAIEKIQYLKRKSAESQKRTEEILHEIEMNRLETDRKVAEQKWIQHQYKKLSERNRIQDKKKPDTREWYNED